jgi:aminocarboxymuconate-semialdehyde decarboxylase
VSRTIDVHAHVVLEATMGAAGAAGPAIEVGPDGPRFRVGDWHLDGVDHRGTAFMDLDLRLARMDAAGIDLQVLSPNPLTWFHHLPAADAARYCRVHNDALSAHVAGRTDRVLGLAQLPAQDPGAAAEEAARALALPGIVGLAMGTDVGRPLSDPELDPLWRAAVDHDAPVFLHPAPAGLGRIVDERALLHDYELHGGFADEEALAVVALVFGGVLDRHPRLDVCISHGGGSTPVLAERLRHAMATRPTGSGDASDVDRGLRRLWFDNHVGGPVAARALVDTVGTERIVLGTNFAGWDDTGPHRWGVDAAVLEANARRLLRLDRGCPHLG